ncbi:hypothetical protein B484DRAFT_265899 [Ochromonadaceae sp. CCMP2298]|nr:hypothetical protein B484DRAFT_265899 [Ochromonadaceae sp. CCMP2298]
MATQLLLDDGIVSSQSRFEPNNLYYPDEATNDAIRFFFSSLESCCSVEHSGAKALEIERLPFSADLAALVQDGSQKTLSVDDVSGGVQVRCIVFADRTCHSSPLFSSPHLSSSLLSRLFVSSPRSDHKRHASNSHPLHPPPRAHTGARQRLCARKAGRLRAGGGGAGQLAGRGGPGQRPAAAQQLHRAPLSAQTGQQRLHEHPQQPGGSGGGGGAPPAHCSVPLG